MEAPPKQKSKKKKKKKKGGGKIAGLAAQLNLDPSRQIAHLQPGAESGLPSAAAKAPADLQNVAETRAAAPKKHKAKRKKKFAFGAKGGAAKGATKKPTAKAAAAKTKPKPKPIATAAAAPALFSPAVAEDDIALEQRKTLMSAAQRAGESALEAYKQLRELQRDFVDEVTTSEIAVGSVTRADLEQQAQRTAEARRDAEEAAALHHSSRLTAVARRKRAALHQIDGGAERASARRRERGRLSRVGLQMRTTRLTELFRAQEARLAASLKREEQLVKQHYGKLVKMNPRLNLRSRWDRRPQPVEITVLNLRALKDKVPRGYYFVRTDLVEHIAGRPAHFPGASYAMNNAIGMNETNPTWYTGHFHDVDLPIGQSNELVTPARVKLKPTMCYLFRVILEFEGAFKKGSVEPTCDLPHHRPSASARRRAMKHVTVGWGILPILDPRFQVAEGFFRIPLLVGDPSDYPHIDTFKHFEEEYAHNLDHWLCNMYFSVRRLSREIERNHWHVNWKCNDAQGKFRPIVFTKKLFNEFDEEQAVVSKTLMLDGRRADAAEVEEGKSSSSAGQGESAAAAAASASPLEHEHERHTTARGGLSQEKTSFMSPEMMAQFQMSMTRRGIDAVSGGQSVSARSQRELAKARFLWQSVVSDMHLDKPISFGFLIAMFVAIACVWIVINMHYFGQYIALAILDAPPFSYTSIWYRVVVKYNSDALTALAELLVMCAGSAMNLVIFIALAAVAKTCQLIFGGWIPDEASRLVCSFGFVAALDPIYIFIIDIASKNYNCHQNVGCLNNYGGANCICTEGDAFKMYWRWENESATGAMGVVFYVAMHGLVALVLCCAVYVYVLYVHLNGRMIDTFRRINGTVEDFFVPHDLEISMGELQHICNKAARWRGPKNERREVATYTFAGGDDSGDGKSYAVVIRKIDHAAAGAASKKKKKKEKEATIWRQFLRQPDGSIVEYSDDQMTKSLARAGFLLPTAESN